MFYVVLFLCMLFPLYSMETAIIPSKKEQRVYRYIKKQPLKKLIRYYQSSSRFEHVIDVAEKAYDGHLLATLMHIYFPKKLIAEYIAPHFINDIVVNYKHALMQHKCQNNELAFKDIRSKHWQTLHNSNGAYAFFPYFKDSYGIWTSNNTTIKKNFPCHDQRRIILLETEQEHEHYKVSVSPDNSNYNKLFFSTTKHHQSECKIIKSSDSIAQTFFSNDTELLLLQLKNGSLILFSPKKDEQYADIFNPYLDEPFLHKNPIVCAMFSPDSMHLVTSSYDESQKKSYIISLPISLFKDINPIGKKIKYNDVSYSGLIRNIFFIDNNYMVTIKKNYDLKLLNALTLRSIDNAFFKWPKDCLKNKICRNNIVSLQLWSSKNQFLIHTLDEHISFQPFPKNSYTNITTLPVIPIAIALSANEHKMVLVDNRNQFYQCDFYSKKEIKNIDFIEHKATIIQLYELICKQNRLLKKNISHEKKTPRFTSLVRTYTKNQSKTA